MSLLCKMKQFFVLLLCVWIILILCMPKTERIIWQSSFTGDMLAVLRKIEFAHLQNAWQANLQAACETAAVALFMPLAYALRNDILQYPYLEGAAYSVILSAQRNRPKTLAYFDKFNWFVLLTRYGIKTPLIRAMITDGVVTTIGEYSMSARKKYIFKPRVGSQGTHVSFETLHSFQQRQYTGAYIAQERVYDCDTPRITRTFRFVSMSDIHNVFSYMLFEQQATEQLASNQHRGATKTVCIDFKSPNLTQQSQQKLDHVITQLLHCHKQEFAFTPSIGWDVIICCDGGYVLEGNIQGGIASDTVKGYQVILKETDMLMRRVFDASTNSTT